MVACYPWIYVLSNLFGRDPHCNPSSSVAERAVSSNKTCLDITLAVYFISAITLPFLRHVPLEHLHTYNGPALPRLCFCGWHFGRRVFNWRYGGMDRQCVHKPLY